MGGDAPDNPEADKLNKLLSGQIENEEKIATEKKQELGREELDAIKAKSSGSFSGAAPTQADYSGNGEEKPPGIFDFLNHLF